MLTRQDVCDLIEVAELFRNRYLHGHNATCLIMEIGLAEKIAARLEQIAQENWPRELVKYPETEHIRARLCKPTQDLSAEEEVEAIYADVGRCIERHKGAGSCVS